MKLKLYIGFYEDSSPERNKENLDCLQHNIENPHIDEIWLFVEDFAPFQHLASDKVRLTASKERWCTFQDFVSHANRESEDFILLIANTDIYFDDSIKLAKESTRPGEILVLGRREVQADGSSFLTEHYESSDAWILRAPTYEFPCDIRLGLVHCESTFLANAQSAGYSLKNISLDVAAYHLHLTKKRNINAEKDKYSDTNRMTFPIFSSASTKSPEKIKESRRIVVDGAVFQTTNVLASRLWMYSLTYLAQTDLGKRMVLFHRGKSEVHIPGIEEFIGPAMNPFIPIASANFLRDVCYKLDAELFISTMHEAPLDVPTLAFFYDMTPETLYGYGDAAMSKLFTIAAADSILAPSNQTARELSAYAPRETEGRIAVAAPGVGDPFSPRSAERVQQFKDKYGITKPYYLLVGGRSGFCNHRNGEILFKALASMPERDSHMILCVGGESFIDPAYSKLLDPKSIMQRYLLDEELADAYSGAQALIYPVLHTGFGLPIVEAMRCKCPVIASRPGSLSEVSGGHVINFDLWNLPQLCEAMQMVREQPIRQALIEKGYNHSLKFTWDKTVKAVESSIRRLLDSSPQY